MEGPSGAGALEVELELRPTESIPIAQVQHGAESLLSLDVSDDLATFGLQADGKPAAPKGAEELVTYYEKQIAATQLVQHRLQKQCDQLIEEKSSLEASLQVQIAALQQQLALVHEKADNAYAEAERSQRQVQEARAALEEMVGSVTQLAELLDASSTIQQLSSSFEEVARSTQRTYDAVIAVDAGAQTVLELQLEVKEACLDSPLLTSHGVVAAGLPSVADALKGLEEDALRLRQELDDSKTREQQLHEELQAAQYLFSGLEAEVVSLQQDQAQAAAKLQVSNEELLAARGELADTKQALEGVKSPAANTLERALTKVDIHLMTIREFLEGLSMPPPLPMSLGSGLSNQEQCVAAQQSQHTACKPVPLPLMPILQAVVASRASTAEGSLADSVGVQTQVVLLTAERDAARQQLGLLSTDLAALEGRYSNLCHECEQLQCVLSATRQQLEQTTASRNTLLTRIEQLEGTVAPATGAFKQQAAAEPPEVSASLAAIEVRARHHEEARLAAEAKANVLQSEKEEAALLLHKLGDEQVALAEQLRALEVAKDALEAERQQLLTRTAELSTVRGDLEAERELLLRRLTQLAARVSSLEDERDALLQQHEEQVSVAAAAGAAGAAAAIAVTHEVTAVSGSPAPSLQPHQSSPVRLDDYNVQAAGTSAATRKEGTGTVHSLAALELRTTELEADLQEAIAARESALRHAARLEAELEAMGDLLQQAADEREEALQQVERIMVERAAHDERHAVERLLLEERLHSAASAAAVATATAAAAAAGAAAGVAFGVPCQSGGNGSNGMATGSPLLLSRAAPSRSDSRRSNRSNRESAGLLLDDDGLSEQVFARAARPSPSLHPQSSHLSFTSEAPLQPARRFTDASGSQTYLEPSDPDELLRPLSTSRQPSGSGHAPSTPRTSGSNTRYQQSSDEVAQLQATVCSLLVSKVMATAQLQAEHDAELSMLRAAHEAQLVRMQDEHAAALAGLQASLPALDSLLSEQGTDSHRRGFSNEELLQQIEALEGQVAALLQGQADLKAHHEDNWRQLQADHLAQLEALRAALDLERASLVVELERQLQAADVQRLALEQQLSDGNVAHDSEMSALQQQLVDRQAAHNVELAALQHELAERGAAHNLEMTLLQQELVQRQAAHDSELSDLQQQLADREATLSSELSTLQKKFVERQTVLGSDVASLQQQLAEIKAAQESELSALRQQHADRQTAHELELAALQRDLAEREVAHGSALSALQQQLADREATLSLQISLLQQQSAERETALESDVASLQQRLMEREAAFNSELSERRLQLAEREAAHQSELSALQQQLAESKLAHESELATLQHQRTERQVADELVLAMLQQQLADREAALRSELSTLQQQYSECEAKCVLDLSVLQQQLADHRTAHGIELAALQRELKEREAAHISEMAVLQQEIVECQVAHDTELSALQQQLADRELALSSELSALQQQYAGSQATLGSQVAALQQQLAECKTECDAQLSALQQLHASREAAHRSEVAALEQKLSDSQAAYDSELAAMQLGFAEHRASCDFELATLLKQHAERQAAYDAEVAALQQRLLEREAAHDSTLSAMHQQVTESEAVHESKLAVLQQQLAECEAKLQHQLAELSATHESTFTALQQQHDVSQAAHESALAAMQHELAQCKAAHASEMAKLQQQLAEQQAVHASELSGLQGLQAQLGQLHLQLRESEGQCADYAASALELRAQLQQLHNERELEEQSLQSLMMTKAWMTDEIRSLQAELKEATTKLKAAEAELTELRSTAAWQQGRAQAQLGILADQLAEAAMQAALAETRLEGQRCPASTAGSSSSSVADDTPSPFVSAAASGMPAAPVDMMVEAVALHGELDMLAAQNRTLQAQLEAVGDELAAAVLRAALAEMQLEDLRLLCAASAAKLATQRFSTTAEAHAEPPASSPQRISIISNDVPRSLEPPSELKRSRFPEEKLPPPDHLGTKPVSPLEQTRHLQSELQSVVRALGEMFGEEPAAPAPASRQALSSLRPAVLTALHISESVASTLQQSAVSSSMPRDGGGQSSWALAESVSGLPPELQRARAAYRDAREVYEALRTDAEELNSRLWRWGNNLREQLVAMERELTRVRSIAAPSDSQQIIQEVVAQKDAYVRIADQRIDGLEAALHETHVHLLHRDGQIIALQDVLVQLTEQLSLFEGVVVRCEVLSSGLVKQG